jgi:hypothetical protein
MGEDASDALGAPEEAGAFVVATRPTGSWLIEAVTAPFSLLVALLASLVGAAVSSAVARSRPPDAPDFGDLGYLALTADEIAIVEAERGLTGRRVGLAVVARAPRDEVTWAELDGAKIEILFAEGRSWKLEAADRRKAEPLVRLLRENLA